MANLTSGDFRPYLNQKFHIHYGQGEMLEVELIEVTDLRENPQNGDADKRTPFSLVWRSAVTTQYLPQHIFTISHDQLGSHEIFIVPIGPDSVGMRYQAIFT
ncbi:MAG: hypothetical protein U0670_24495 [Anaerolineae bacterium]